ncbi:putative hemolysin-iii channel protein [Botrytis fragariae]|uniref:Putative hemolysin-iii channel protein n=1 Tax=Botrytis fragariae TaxID=1964551 RepID=A0A8H6AHB5_9HELO|nr:putative hemolysin-iii channel protein [Botrytis fragariae]KAF5867439.1 putative hemolysin-iii channel protein [Botrytis fragariae]
MSNSLSGQDEGRYGYAGAYPFFASDLENERLDEDADADAKNVNVHGNGNGYAGENGNGDEIVSGNRMGKARQHVRHISSATTLIVTREEGDEGDKVQVPEKALIIGRGRVGGVGLYGDGDMEERGEKNDDAELGLKRNATGLSMGGLEVLVRDEDIELEGGDVGRYGDGSGNEGEERMGKILRWDEVSEWRQDNEYILTGYRYHTLNNHSHQTAAFWIELDYLGIVALMWGSTVATIYHGFICDVKLQRIYWSMITLLSLALTLFTLVPPFRTPFFRPYRTLMYAALGLSAVIFIVHSIIIYGIALQYKRLSLGWIVGMAGLNFVGALAYSLRIPEKYYPGRFDIYGNSHQILHCMVVLAALAHFAGLVQSFDYLHSGIEECPVG